MCWWCVGGGMGLVGMGWGLVWGCYIEWLGFWVVLVGWEGCGGGWREKFDRLFEKGIGCSELRG